MAPFTYHTNYTTSKTNLNLFHLTLPPPKLPSLGPSSFSQHVTKLRTVSYGSLPFLLVTDTRVIKDKTKLLSKGDHNVHVYRWNHPRCNIHYVVMGRDPTLHPDSSVSTGETVGFTNKWYNLPSQTGAVVSKHYTPSPKNLRHRSSLALLCKNPRWFLKKNGKTEEA